jgi:hypothetical protein
VIVVLPVATERKAFDTRPLVYWLTNPDQEEGYPLSGATVSITIARPDGSIISGACEVLDVATGQVAYLPAESDFSSPGTYAVQWLATYENGTVARWPYDKTFGRVKIHPTVEDSAGAARMSIDALAVQETISVLIDSGVTVSIEVTDGLSLDDSTGMVFSAFLYVDSGALVVDDAGQPVSLTEHPDVDLPLDGPTIALGDVDGQDLPLAVKQIFETETARLAYDVGTADEGRVFAVSDTHTIWTYAAALGGWFELEG